MANVTWRAGCELFVITVLLLFAAMTQAQDAPNAQNNPENEISTVGEPSANAGEPSANENTGAADTSKTDATPMPATAEWLIEKRDRWSDNITAMAVNIDRFFAGETSREENESYLRLRLGMVYERIRRVCNSS